MVLAKGVDVYSIYTIPMKVTLHTCEIHHPVVGPCPPQVSDPNSASSADSRIAFPSMTFLMTDWASLRSSVTSFVFRMVALGPRYDAGRRIMEASPRKEDRGRSTRGEVNGDKRAGDKCYLPGPHSHKLNARRHRVHSIPS